MANAHSTPGFLEMNGSGENLGSIAGYDGLAVEYISGGTFGSVYKVELPFSTVVARKVVEQESSREVAGSVTNLAFNLPWSNFYR